jgi:F0F1-type ATP synthase membrane subunit b/b'
VVKLALAATEVLIGKALDEKSQRELITQYIDEAKLK